MLSLVMKGNTYEEDEGKENYISGNDTSTSWKALKASGNRGKGDESHKNISFKENMVQRWRNRVPSS